MPPPLLLLRQSRLTRVKSGQLLDNVSRFLQQRKFSQAQESQSRTVKRLWEAPLGHKSDFTVFNSLAKRKTPLVLERQNVVKWYSCGPTVYDHSHIGHAFCYVRFDMIRRLLESENMSVVYAMNITDIDDKIIKKSLELKRSSRDLAREYEVSFFQDMADLNVLPPSSVLRVTDYMPTIIDFVQKLLESGKAYKTSDSVYFDSTKDSGYPRFRYNESLAPLTKEKRNYADSALWKLAKPNEPYWDAPFGAGRPGWHVECSAMASKVFGSSIDIHSGGKDLEFPHHENEEAHSCAFHECSNWAKFFLHAGHIQYDSEKMSKSLGNVVSIKDYLKSGSSDEFRIMCLRFPYRFDIQFTDDMQANARKTLAKLTAVLTECDDYLQGKFSADVNEEQLLQNLFLAQMKVRESFQDDFNFAEATYAVLNLVQALSAELKEIDGYSASAYVAVASLRDYIRKYFNTLGLRLTTKGETAEGGDRLKDIVDTSVKFRSDIRTTALSLKSEEKAHLLKLCDEFRDDLKHRGILVNDKVERSSWSAMK